VAEDVKKPDLTLKDLKDLVAGWRKLKPVSPEQRTVRSKNQIIEYLKQDVIDLHVKGYNISKITEMINALLDKRAEIGEGIRFEEADFAKYIEKHVSLPSSRRTRKRKIAADVRNEITGEPALEPEKSLMNGTQDARGEEEYLKESEAPKAGRGRFNIKPDSPDL
jgi:hypothetical protein